MAEEDVTEPTETVEPTEAKEAPAPPAVTKAELDALKAGFDTQFAALNDTVKGALTARQQAQVVGPNGEINITPAMAQILRQNGYTDADIKANAPVIVPWLMALLQTDGQVLIGGIKQVDDKVAMLEAAEDTETYPYWKDVLPQVRKLRKAAEKEGRYLAPADAYQAAVAADVASPESRIDAARTRLKTKASNSDDASAQNVQHTGTRPGQGATRRTALTAEDLAAMPRAERKKYFDSIGDLAIK